MLTLASLTAQPLVHTYSNGLTVCLSENHAEPRIACAIAVRAGNVHETDSTHGLAYLAAHNFVSDEYTALLNSWNAITHDSQITGEWTIFEEEIPANRLEQWLCLQQERFTKPAFRLSTNDLFRITDQINAARNDDHQRAYALLRATLYPEHPYGRTLTDGLSELLEDTTLTLLKTFYNHFYTPEKTTLFLSGNFKSEDIISLIDKYLGNISNTTSLEENNVALPPMPQMMEQRLTGDYSTFVTVGFRLDIPHDARHWLLLEILYKILYNRCNGLIDAELQQNHITKGLAFTRTEDHSAMLILAGYPKENQPLAEIREMLLQKIMQLKTGDFPDDLLTLAKRQVKLEWLQQKQHNDTRVQQMLQDYQLNGNGELVVRDAPFFDGITKKQIVDFANRYLQDNFATIYKALGEAARPDRFLLPRCVTKMKHNESECARIEKLKTQIAVKNNPSANTNAVANIPGLFTLQFIFPAGELNDLLLPYAVGYWDVLGTRSHTRHALQARWQELGCNCEVECSDTTTTVTLSGLSECTVTALSLLSEQVQEAIPDTHALHLLIENALWNRQQAKKSLNSILNCTRNYCEYGSELIQYQLHETQLKALTCNDLLNAFRRIWQYQPQILYNGSESIQKIRKLITKTGLQPKRYSEPPAAQHFERTFITHPTRIYFLPYPTKQAHIIRYQCDELADTSLANIAQYYSETFGNGKISSLFKELTENQKLPLGNCSAAYIVPKDATEKMYHYIYVSTAVNRIADMIQALDTIPTNSYHIDFQEFYKNHIANRPPIYMIVAPEEAANDIEQSPYPVTRLSLEHVFGY